MVRLSRAALQICFFGGLTLLSSPGVCDETLIYRYDGRGRLKQVSRSGTVNDGVQAAYSYDKADNRTNVTVSGSSIADFAISDVSATEGAPLVFTITRTGPTIVSQTINYATSNGTATAGSDYIASSGTLTFAIGQSSNTVSVSTIDDAIAEPSETINLALSAASGSATISDGLGLGTIIDNDAPPPSFAINDVSGYEGAGATVVFTVTRFGSSSGSYSVNFTTANGSATSTSDYYSQSGTLTFLSGETTKTITISLRNGTQAESTETFFVNLSSPTGGATISDPQGIANIYDDDEGDPCPLCRSSGGSTNDPSPTGG